MPLSIASIASGSNGNCYYVGSEDEAVLIDVGIACKEVERRMRRIGLTMETVKAIFISHEHTDHISGVGPLARRYNLPVYITPATHRSKRVQMDGHRAASFYTGIPVQVGSLAVLPFAKHHDACDPHSFVVSSASGTTVGVFTDIGRPCDGLVSQFKRCDAAFLESNYCEAMLDSGRYPYFLKTRIRGGNGHLSNKQALQLFLAHRSSRLSHLLLSHISKENNAPELVMETFSPHAANTEIVIAGRYEETAVYTVSCGRKAPTPLVQGLPVRQVVSQMALF